MIAIVLIPVLFFVAAVVLAAVVIKDKEDV